MFFTQATPAPSTRLLYLCSKSTALLLNFFPENMGLDIKSNIFPFLGGGGLGVNKLLITLMGGGYN